MCCPMAPAAKKNQAVAPKSSQIFWLKLMQMISILDCSPKHGEMERNKLLKCLVDTDCFCPAAETTVGLAFVCRGVCSLIFQILHSMLSVPTFGPHLAPARGRRRGASNFATFVGRRETRRKNTVVGRRFQCLHRTC